MARFAAFCHAVAIGFGGLLGTASAQALDYAVEGDVLFLEGEIFTEDLAKMRRVLKQNPGLKTVVLEDVPGSNDDATNVQIIRLFRAAGLGTHLEADSHVASGGTDLFLSGVTRTMDPGAEIGVHSWSDGQNEGIDFPRDSQEHALFLELYAELGIDAGFYWFTLQAAPAAGMHYMTENEIARFGLLTSQIGDGDE